MYSSRHSSRNKYDTTNLTRAKLVKNAVHPEKVCIHARIIFEHSFQKIYEAY